MRIVDTAVVAEKMIEPAARIDRARMVERHRVADVIEQEARVAEVGHGFQPIFARTVSTAASAGGAAPGCRHAAVPAATA